MAASSLRRVTQRLLQSIGLELRSTSDDLRVNLARAERRADDARRGRTRNHKEMLLWKARAATVLQREARWRERYDTLKANLTQTVEERLAKKDAAFNKALERVQRERDADLARLQELSARIEEAERRVWTERENLSVVELKLDLVEGAVNTLDRRYRNLVKDPADPSE